jgi:hypothetical protein
VLKVFHSLLQVQNHLSSLRGGPDIFGFVSAARQQEKSEWKQSRDTDALHKHLPTVNLTTDT